MQTISSKTLEDTMYYRNIPIFTYKINYPCFTTACSPPAALTINEYYTMTSRKTELYCRTVLYPQAMEQAKYISGTEPPFNNFEFESIYHITYNENCITSLYIDEYTYMGGAHGTTIRKSNTWDFHTGRQLKLQDYFHSDLYFPQSIFRNIGQQISERQKDSPSSYFDDFSILLRENFRSKNYYLKPGGVIIYYQQYDIAPYASGLPEFFIPIHTVR